MSDRSAPGGQRALRVLVVDADRRVRRDLTELLVIQPGVEVAGSAADASAARAALDGGDLDVVVVDPRLPSVEDGLALVAELRRRSPARIVVLSHDAALRTRALAMGADAFLTEADRPAALMEAIAGPQATEPQGRSG